MYPLPISRVRPCLSQAWGSNAARLHPDIVLYLLAGLLVLPTVYLSLDSLYSTRRIIDLNILMKEGRRTGLARDFWVHS